MADNKYKNFLVNKVDLASVAKTGKISTDITKSEESKKQEKLYISVKQQDETTSQKSTSPSENMSVLMVQDEKTGKASYSPSVIKKYAELRKNGKLPEGVSISREPVGKYLEKQFSKYEIDFQKAIQSRDNSNLGLVALYITKANENNDQVALGMMIELIKNDPNFAFAFRGETLDLDKLKDLSLMNESDVKVGFDVAEEKDELTHGKFDSTKKSAQEIDALAEQDISQELEASQQEISTNFDLEIDNAKTEEEVADVSNNARKNIVKNMAAMVAGLGMIRNVATRQKGIEKINEAQAKSEQKIDSQAKANALRVKSLRKKEKSNNSLENLFNRSNLAGKTDDTPQLANRDKSDDRAREEKEKIERQHALERAKARQAAGKKLNARDQELLEQDKAERIKLGEQKMKELNTMGQYRAEDSIQNTVKVGKESAERREKESQERTSGKNDQVQEGNER